LTIQDAQELVTLEAAGRNSHLIGATGADLAGLGMWLRPPHLSG